LDKTKLLVKLTEEETPEKKEPIVNKNEGFLGSERQILYGKVVLEIMFDRFDALPRDTEIEQEIINVLEDVKGQENNWLIGAMLNVTGGITGPGNGKLALV